MENFRYNILIYLIVEFLGNKHADSTLDDADDDAGRMAKQASAGCDRIPQGREQDLTGKTGYKADYPQR